jgi:hypothetical protein
MTMTVKDMIDALWEEVWDRLDTHHRYGVIWWALGELLRDTAEAPAARERRVRREAKAN